MPFSTADYRPRDAQHGVLYSVVEAMPLSPSSGGGPYRLRMLDDGRGVLTLKTAWADGPRHLVFEPLELLERLAAITPRPGAISCSTTGARTSYPLAGTGRGYGAPPVEGRSPPGRRPPWMSTRRDR